jgi:hypothetical protein
MKKILFLIITLLFSSLATAENEAVYNEVAGSIEIPVLSVKGQAEKFSVTLQQEDTEDLIFTIIDAIPDPEVESSTNEATYDPETGVVIIPSVMVLKEGQPSVKSYSVELQLTEESIFKILQIEPILALPTNTFNGIPSETLDISVAEKASSRCTGNPSQNLDTARQNFKTKCGEPWNDQKHVCDYKPDGFHCSGNVSTSTTPAPTNPTTSNPTASGSSRCTGNPSQNLATARENFKTKCGEPWNNQKHVCEYKDADGFHCSGNVSASTTPTNPTTSNPPATNDWCTGTPDRNRDVAKRNFATACGQTWNDQLGHVCVNKSDGWHCSGTITNSASSIPRAPREVKARRWHPHVVLIRWNISDYEPFHTYWSESRPRGFKIFRNGRQIAFVSKDKSEFVDKVAPSGRPSYQVVVVSAGNISSPSSNVADYSLTSRIATRNGNRLEYPPRGGVGSRDLQMSVDVIQGTPDTPVTTFATITNSDGENLGSISITHNGENFAARADSPYAGVSNYSSGDLPLSPEVSEVLQQGFIEWIETSFPEKPVRTTPPPRNEGDGDRDPPGAGDGDCSDNDCVENGGKPSVAPTEPGDLD